MIHYSVDDTIGIFKYLTENNCNSVFENPVLAFFKNLHDNYGFKASMYCFYEKGGFSLDMCTDKYKKEFEENSDWLRFGFHSLDEDTGYSECDAETFTEHLTKVLKELKRIVSEKALTYNVRLGFGQGNLECIKAMKETIKDFNILYGVDDNRTVYHLNKEQNELYLKNKSFYDENIGITIKHCELRLELDKQFDETVKKLKPDLNYVFFTHEEPLEWEEVISATKMLCETGHKFTL